jgi:hypothetical protein
MAGHALPRVTRRGRVWRGLWPGRNPLRRTCDRVGAAIVAVLLAAFLIGAPLLALAAGQRAYDAALRAEDAQRATRRPVPAVLLTNAPAPAVCWCALLMRPRVLARWTTPDGSPHTGLVAVPATARAGSTVKVWVGPAGWPAGPPLTSSQVVSRAILAAVVAPMAVGIFILGAGAAAHWVLDRRRLARWDAEWRATGPRWTSSR